jgi:ATP-binding cassette, subfamily B, multidrug efflux pump
MQTLRRLASYIKPFPWLVALLFGGMLAGISADLTLPRLLGWTIDRGLTAGSMPAVVRYVALLAGLSLVRASLRYVQGYSQERLGQEVIRKLRHDLYVKLQRLDFGYYTVHATGDIMSRVTSDLYSIMDFFGFGLAETLASSLMFVGTLVMLLILDWRLALGVAAPVPVLMLVAFRFSGIVGPKWERIRKEMGHLTTTLQESLSGIRVVKAFSRERDEMHRFDDRNVTMRSVNLDRAATEARTFPLLDFVSGLCFVVLYGYGGHRVLSGEMTLGTLTAFNWYLWGLIWPIRFLGFLISLARRAMAAAPRVFEVLDEPSEIAEPAQAHPMPRIEGHIVFDNVTFAFPDGDGTPVLKGLNLEVQPGQVAAVLGGTGSGKSSLINLVPRFYDPQEGRILIDGVDIRDVSVHDLRRQIGIVPQETFLFSDTIRNNIAFGKPDATQEEVEAAARAAQAHDFIAEMQDGYETRVGERGVGISGGQKQRVAIARALLTDPRILILDEATSSVDAETEHLLQQALDELMRGRTSLVIAQRLSTVQNADVVLVLRDGRVVEKGSHEELLALGGEYTRIYNLQLRPQYLTEES